MKENEEHYCGRVTVGKIYIDDKISIDYILEKIEKGKQDGATLIRSDFPAKNHNDYSPYILRLERELNDEDRIEIVLNKLTEEEKTLIGIK